MNPDAAWIRIRPDSKILDPVHPYWQSIAAATCQVTDLVMFRCHFLKFDTITIRLLQKIAIIDTISIFLKTQ